MVTIYVNKIHWKHFVTYNSCNNGQFWYLYEDNNIKSIAYAYIILLAFRFSTKLKLKCFLSLNYFLDSFKKEVILK